MTALGALPAGLGEADLVAAVRDVLDDALAQGAAAGLAVSGGADSVALAWLATRARPDVGWTVVHVRHGLRDDHADSATAAACAEAVGAAYEERTVTVPLPRRRGLEAAAREARMHALADVSAAHGLAACCLGHTADDRAETVILNLARGSGLNGLGALRPIRRVHGMLLVRPLLRLRRDDVRAVARGSGLPVVEDPMNADVRFRRARVRAEALPALARLSGGAGDPVGVLCRLADLAADDADALDAIAVAQAADHLVAWGPVRALREAALAGAHPALARRVVRALAAAVGDDASTPSAADVERVLALETGQTASLSGAITVTRGQGWLTAAPAHPPPVPLRALAVPGAVPVPEAGVEVRARERLDEPAGARLPPTASEPVGPRSARLPAQRGLAVRGLRPGDRIRWSGRAGSRVSRLLAEAGVPAPARGLVPLVVDADDEVLWVPGVAAREPHPGATHWVWLAPLAADR